MLRAKPFADCRVNVPAGTVTVRVVALNVIGEVATEPAVTTYVFAPIFILVLLVKFKSAACTETTLARKTKVITSKLIYIFFI